MKDKVFNVLDLFCGCGGLSHGFENAGYDIALGIDSDKSSIDTFNYNHKNAKALDIDLSKDDFVDNINKFITCDIDIVIGGPPCQGFSLTGPRNLDDPRNKLYMAMYQTVLNYRPKAFLIENVPGLSTLYNGQVKNGIIRTFADIGYNLNTKILLAADYGVPQFRKRFFIIGIRSDYGLTFHFPPPVLSRQKYVTCHEAIGDLPSRENELGEEVDNYSAEPFTSYQKHLRNDCNVLYNHVATDHSEKVKQVISLVPEGGNYKDLPPGVGEHRKFNEAWTRYHSQEPSRTIDTGHRNHFHYKYNRVPTIRENARLQSFPDHFRFMGNKTQQNRQVGNAVPPLLAEVLAVSLREQLFGEYKMNIQTSIFDKESIT